MTSPESPVEKHRRISQVKRIFEELRISEEPIQVEKHVGLSESLTNINRGIFGDIINQYMNKIY